MSFILKFLPLNVTLSFLHPVRLRLSFLHHSSLHRFLCFIKCRGPPPGPLAPWQPPARRLQEVQCQPIRTPFSSRCHGEREKVKAADRGGEKNKTDHFISHRTRRGDQTSAYVMEGSQRTSRSNRPQTINSVRATRVSTGPNVI